MLTSDNGLLIRIALTAIIRINEQEFDLSGQTFEGNSLNALKF